MDRLGCKAVTLLDEQKKVLKGKMLAKHCLEIFDQYMCIAKMQSVLCENLLPYHLFFFQYFISSRMETRFFFLPTNAIVSIQNPDFVNVNV